MPHPLSSDGERGEVREGHTSIYFLLLSLSLVAMGFSILEHQSLLHINKGHIYRLWLLLHIVNLCEYMVANSHPCVQVCVPRNRIPAYVQMAFWALR